MLDEESGVDQKGKHRNADLRQRRGAVLRHSEFVRQCQDKELCQVQVLEPKEPVRVCGVAALRVLRGDHEAVVCASAAGGIRML